MNYDLQKADLSAVVAEARLVADETRRIYRQLSAAQINCKPGQGDSSARLGPQGEGAPAIPSFEHCHQSGDHRRLSRSAGRSRERDEATRELELERNTITSPI